MRNFVDGGEAIIEAFRNLNIEYVISSPGSEWGPVWEALADQKVEGRDGPIYLSCWHETLAVNLAAGYTSVTGKMQAVLLHSGVGLLQGSNGIQGAQVSETPMMVLSGGSASLGEDPEFDPGHQWLASLTVVGGYNRLMEPIVKWTDEVSSPATLYETVMRTGEMAQRVPMGPTYISVPIENMLHEWKPPARMRKAPPVPKPRPADADIESVAKQLIAAKNPVILTESIGRDPEGFDALLELAELLAIPVIEGAVADFANFPKNNTLHQGFMTSPFLAEADLALLVRSRVPWYPTRNRPENATVIAIDENPLKGHMAYQNIQADMFVEGDAVATLRLVTEAVRAVGTDGEAVAARRAECEAAHNARQADLRKAEDEVRDQAAIDPVTLCTAMNAVLPDNAIYVDETITHRRFLRNHLRWNGKQDYFRVAGGLGQGLGIALGVKLARPKRPVVSVIGDGSLLYNPITQSLGFSMEANLPILIIVFNNVGYTSMKNNHLSYYPDGVSARNDIFYGHPIKGPNYAELIEPFGGFGRKVEDPAELEGALRDGLAAVEDGKTAIINVVLGR